jgi:hypothetical protein
MHRTASLVAIALASLASPALAAPITYTETVVASGSLGGTPFTNALVTFTQTADTAAITTVSPGLLEVQDITSTVSVAGVGAGAFAGPTVTFVNQASIAANAGLAVDTVSSNGPIILNAFNPALAAYNLATSIGPVSGPLPTYAPGTAFATFAGDFVINVNGISGNSTFQATLVAAVPEPSSLVMAGAAALAGLGYAWRRRRSA